MAIPAPTTPASLNAKQTVIAGSMEREESMRDTLPYLPPEIQLQILRAHMASSQATPLVDWPFVNAGPRTQSSEETDSWKKSMLKALLVSRFFWEEGWKYFWQQNRFLVSPGGTSDRLRHHIQWSRAALQNLRHLQLRRVVSINHTSWLQSALYACEAADNFANLDTLEVDFAVRVSAFGRISARASDLDKPDRSTMHAHRYYEHFRHSLLRGSATIGHNVKKITVTGLPKGILGCLIVRLLVTLLRKQGTIALGTGHRGTKYVCCDDDEDFRIGRGKLELETLQAEDIDQWIDEEVTAVHNVPSWWSWFATSDEREGDASYLEWRKLVRMVEGMAAQ